MIKDKKGPDKITRLRAFPFGVLLGMLNTLFIVIVLKTIAHGLP
jgi:hypothetical protein